MKNISLIEKIGIILIIISIIILFIDVRKVESLAFLFPFGGWIFVIGVGIWIPRFFKSKKENH